MFTSEEIVRDLSVDSTIFHDSRSLTESGLKEFREGKKVDRIDYR